MALAGHNLLLPTTTLILIGGGDRPIETMQTFVDSAKQKPIWILPWGTNDPIGSFQNIQQDLLQVGADPQNIFCACEPALAEDEIRSLKENLNRAGAVFFPGGNQNILFANLKQNDLVQTVRDLYIQGVTIAGTSAGTAIQSDPMLTGQGSEYSEGIGLLPLYIIDQHFLVRDRESRLLQALTKYGDPRFQGLGIDENMSVIVRNGFNFQPLGPSKVFRYTLESGNYIRKEL